MKLEKHLEETYEVELLEELISSPLYLDEESKSNPKEIAKYYYDMKKLNPKASPWIILLGMAKEAGVKPDKLLSQFPPKERNEIRHSAPITGPWLEQMSGTDIAKELGVTRQAVSSTIKKGLPKFYQGTKDMNPKMRPWDILLLIAKKTGMREEPVKLLKLMPKKIRQEIEKDAERFRK